VSDGARAEPDGTLLLVHTHDTAEGARRAAAVGRELAALGREARRILDEAGLAGATLLASGDLDDPAIADPLARGAGLAVGGHSGGPVPNGSGYSTDGSAPRPMENRSAGRSTRGQGDVHVLEAAAASRRLGRGRRGAPGGPGAG
jgi:hypothetical protein